MDLWVDGSMTRLVDGSMWVDVGRCFLRTSVESMVDGSMDLWVDGSMTRWVDNYGSSMDAIGRWVDGSVGQWVDGLMDDFWVDGYIMQAKYLMDRL